MTGRRPFALVAVGIAVVTALILATATPVPSVGGHGSTGPANASPTQVADTTRADANVTVGVLDVTAFDAGVAGRADVEAVRGFGGRDPTAGGAPTHGGRVVRLVERIAPDADYALATVDGPNSYRAGLSWLRERGVDVVVTPTSFYGLADDGTSAVETATTLATRSADAGVRLTADAPPVWWSAGLYVEDWVRGRRASTRWMNRGRVNGCGSSNAALSAHRRAQSSIRA
ncbi:hypothetical protein [Halarchaeum sp. P4]|uniref:hypothetical protein n=1 Tax=Halarchaeum sp. P4 TaxID=3421639 RepID=UPI003EBFCFD9